MGLSKEDVPPQVEEAIMDQHGTIQGNEWLDHAIEQVNTLEDNWDFHSVEVLPSGEASLVVKVEEDSEGEAVLKIPSNSQTGLDEIAALKIWEDCNVPNLKQEDLDTGSFLMDYVNSTDKLITPFQAFVLADVMHTPAANFHHEFPSLRDNMTRRIVSAYQHQMADHSISLSDIDLAVKIVEALLSSQDHEELLHGDYRAQNLIYSDSGPIIIDPQPCLGETVFDIALWLADTEDYENIAVVLELLGSSGSRLVPWVWSLSVLNQLKPESPVPAARVLKDQASKWLQRQE